MWFEGTLLPRQYKFDWMGAVRQVDAQTLGS